MKKHKDLISVLRLNKQRITPARTLLLQYILDHSAEQIPLRDIHSFFEKKMPGIDRSSIYRNLESFKKLNIIREIKIPGASKGFQYIFDRKIHDYFICKSCGRLIRGNRKLFKKIEAALSGVPGFSKTGLSIVFFGSCSSCKV